MTLTEFLLARIAEDEAVARAADDGPWVFGGYPRSRTEVEIMLLGGGVRTASVEGQFSGVFRRGESPVAQVPILECPPENWSIHNAGHAAHFDPTRVLAECEARRRIIALWDDDWASDLANEDLVAAGGWQMYADLLALLALPYADHPDYREEWRP